MSGFRLWEIAGWTMLHYFWVGAALGVVALLVRQRLQSSGASVRYLVALGSLLLLSIAPAAIAVVVTQDLAPGASLAERRVRSVGQSEEMRLHEIGPTSASTNAPAPARGSDLAVRPIGMVYGERLITALNVVVMYLPVLRRPGGCSNGPPGCLCRNARQPLRGVLSLPTA